MAKSTLLGIVAVVAMAGQANGQGTPWSLLYEDPAVGYTDVTTVPAGGLVVTDVLLLSDRPDPTFDYYLGQSSGAVTVNKMRFIPSVDGTQFHFETGIPFDAGETIRVLLTTGNDQPINLLLSGYIPSSGFVGGVPAVGTIGLVVMVCMLLGAGGVVMRRRVAV